MSDIRIPVVTLQSDWENNPRAHQRAALLEAMFCNAVRTAAEEMATWDVRKPHRIIIEYHCQKGTV